jgi:hypothetical protein
MEGGLFGDHNGTKLTVVQLSSLPPFSMVRHFDKACSFGDGRQAGVVLSITLLSLGLFLERRKTQYDTHSIYTAI